MHSIQVFNGDGVIPVTPLPRLDGIDVNMFDGPGIHVVGGGASAGKTAAMVRMVCDYAMFHPTTKCMIIDGWGDNSIKRRFDAYLKASSADFVEDNIIIRTATDEQRLVDAYRGFSGLVAIEGIEAMLPTQNQAMAMRRRLRSLQERSGDDPTYLYPQTRMMVRGVDDMGADHVNADEAARAMDVNFGSKAVLYSATNVALVNREDSTFSVLKSRDYDCGKVKVSVDNNGVMQWPLPSK